MKYQAPLADQKTLQFAVDFCTKELSAYGVLAVYLIGSRANGQSRDNSDYDVLVVLSDSAPTNVSLGGTLHAEIFTKLDSQRRTMGLGAIDLITQRETHHMSTRTDAGSFASAVANGGIQLL